MYSPDTEVSPNDADETEMLWLHTGKHYRLHTDCKGGVMLSVIAESEQATFSASSGRDTSSTKGPTWYHHWLMVSFLPPSTPIGIAAWGSNMYEKVYLSQSFSV